MAETNELVAGRALDALIAEKVMGWERFIHDPRIQSLHPGEWFLMHPSQNVRYRDDLTLAVPAPEDAPQYDNRYSKDAGSYPHYSTEIADAWLVVEKLDDHAFWCQVARHRTGWVVTFAPVPRPHETPIYEDAENDYPYAVADTPALAVCLAALASLSPDAAHEGKETDEE